MYNYICSEIDDLVIVIIVFCSVKYFENSWCKKTANDGLIKSSRVNSPSTSPYGIFYVDDTNNMKTHRLYFFQKYFGFFYLAGVTHRGIQRKHKKSQKKAIVNQCGYRKNKQTDIGTTTPRMVIKIKNRKKHCHEQTHRLYVTLSTVLYNAICVFVNIFSCVIIFFSSEFSIYAAGA